MAEKSKILIIGGTGHIGRYLVEASYNEGHESYMLVRESTLLDTSSPEKALLIQKFKDFGVTLLLGDLYDHESLVKAIKKVDVVISAVGNPQLHDQDRIVAAVKEAGNVKRFLPAEYGTDSDRVKALEPAKSMFARRAQIRRLIEAENIPHTYVSGNFFAGIFVTSLTQIGPTCPPRDKVVILGDGNTKVVFNREMDIATFAIKAVDDPRTLNKTLYVRPRENTVTLNELVSIWEKKIGQKLERTYIPEEEVIKMIEESPPKLSLRYSIRHSVFIRGGQTYFEINPSSGGVEATQLYPDVKYATVDEMLDEYV